MVKCILALKKLLSVIAICALIINSYTPAFADTITHFGDGPFSDVPSLLDDVGIGQGNVGSETTAEIFMIPGAGMMLVTVTFDLERDTGGFDFNFGYYDPADGAAFSPVTEKEDYATAVLASAVEVFDDTADDPGATASFMIESGTDVGFYLIPNNLLTAFNAAPGDFYPPLTSPDNLRAPLFSESDANPGEFDQMLSFVGNGVTLFTFEDLTRTGSSDQDFTDLAFTIDTELIPMCSPGQVGTPPNCRDPTVGGSLIPIDTTMVLLAGTHMSAAWMIPVIVAGIGFAIVIARKF